LTACIEGVQQLHTASGGRQGGRPESTGVFRTVTVDIVMRNAMLGD
jgi:hypothetical protein